jgi:hypothetical protein
MAVTTSEDGTLRLWPTAVATERTDDLKRWAETTTGMTMDSGGTTRWLSVADWWLVKNRREN